MLITIVRDLDATDEFHDEEWPPGFRRPSIEYLGDVWMVHQSQRLSLGFEPGDDAPGVHAWLDDFQRNLATNGFLLFRHEHHTAPSLADLLEQFVPADAITWL